MNRDLSGGGGQPKPLQQLACINQGFDCPVGTADQEEARAIGGLFFSALYVCFRKEADITVF